jgi:hypothetical protein
LVPRNEAQALKLGRHHHRLPMAAVTINGEVLACQPSGNHGLNLFCSHFVQFKKYSISL